MTVTGRNLVRSGIYWFCGGGSKSMKWLEQYEILTSGQECGGANKDGLSRVADLPLPTSQCGLQSLCWRSQLGQCPSRSSRWPSSGCPASSRCMPGAGTRPGSQGSLPQCPAGRLINSVSCGKSADQKHALTRLTQQWSLKDCSHRHCCCLWKPYCYPFVMQRRKQLLTGRC